MGQIIPLHPDTFGNQCMPAGSPETMLLNISFPMGTFGDIFIVVMDD